jgi:hypothetical protein
MNDDDITADTTIEATPVVGPRTRRKSPQEPLAYKVICISIYLTDLDAATQMVADIKARKLPISLSRLVRLGLRKLDIDEVCEQLSTEAQLR